MRCSASGALGSLAPPLTGRQAAQRDARITLAPLRQHLPVMRSVASSLHLTLRDAAVPLECLGQSRRQWRSPACTAPFAPQMVHSLSFAPLTACNAMHAWDGKCSSCSRLHCCRLAAAAAASCFARSILIKPTHSLPFTWCGAQTADTATAVAATSGAAASGAATWAGPGSEQQRDGSGSLHAAAAAAAMHAVAVVLLAILCRSQITPECAQADSTAHMEPPCPAPPEVAFQALEFVRNAPRPTARLADLLSYCQLCCREVQASAGSMATSAAAARRLLAAACSPPVFVPPSHLNPFSLLQKDPVSMASLMLSHGALLWLSDAANPDNTVGGRSTVGCLWVHLQGACMHQQSPTCPCAASTPRRRSRAGWWRSPS